VFCKSKKVASKIEDRDDQENLRLQVGFDLPEQFANFVSLLLVKILFPVRILENRFDDLGLFDSFHQLVFPKEIRPDVESIS